MFGGPLQCFQLYNNLVVALSLPQNCRLILTPEALTDPKNKLINLQKNATFSPLEILQAL